MLVVRRLRQFGVYGFGDHGGAIFIRVDLVGKEFVFPCERFVEVDHRAIGLSGDLFDNRDEFGADDAVADSPAFWEGLKTRGWFMT